MDNLRKEINKLFDDFEKDDDSSILAYSKYITILRVLKCKSNFEFNQCKNIFNRIKRIDSKKCNIYSKNNNLKKMLDEI